MDRRRFLLGLAGAFAATALVAAGSKTAEALPMQPPPDLRARTETRACGCDRGRP